jgi:PAS domain S-box-containing protein
MISWLAEPKNAITKIIALSSIITGIIVFLAWIFNIVIMISPLGRASMTFTTATCFVFSGVTLYYMCKVQEGKHSTAEIALPISGFATFLFLSSSIVSVLTGISEKVTPVYSESSNVFFTMLLGIPSYATILGFALVTLTGLFFMSHKKLRKFIPKIGIMISVIGSIAIIGHIINYSPLFYSNTYSTGMAIHTAVLFTTLGIGLRKIPITLEEKKESIKIKTKLVTLFLSVGVIPAIFAGYIFYNLGRVLASPDNINAVVVFFGSLLLAIFIYAYHTAWSMTAPLLILRDATKKIAIGNYDHYVVLNGTKEMEDLSSDINKMTKALQKSMRETRDILRVLDRASLVSIADKHGNITYVNDMFCKVSKYAREELVGKNHRVIKSGFHPPEFYEGIWKTITSGKIWEGEIKNKAKDGTFYWVKTVIAPIFEDDKKHAYISIRTDITKEKELDRKILERERFSAIGELSARIAHAMSTIMVLPFLS